MLALTCAVCLWPPLQSVLIGLNITSQLLVKSHLTSVTEADFSRLLETNTVTLNFIIILGLLKAEA